MKKKDIYEISIRLTGFFLLIYAFRPLLEIIAMSIVIDKTNVFSSLIADSMLSVAIKFFIYLLIGLLFIYKTKVFLKLFKFNDETTINFLSYFQTMHVVIIFLAALLIINNLDGVSTFRYFKEEPKMEYYDLLQERMSGNGTLPKQEELLSMKIQKTRNMNIGAIIGVFILVFSRKIANGFISKTEMIGSNN